MGTSGNIVNKKDMNHLIGDAFYRTDKYAEAVPFLEKYDKEAQTTRDEDYQLGYAYFKTRSYDSIQCRPIHISVGILGEPWVIQQIWLLQHIPTQSHKLSVALHRQ